MCITGAILGSAVLGAASANKAAKAGTAAAKNDLALKERIYEESVDRLAPYSGAGNNALSAYLYELGLGEAPMMASPSQSTVGTQYEGISMSPAAQFLLTQGRDTIEAGAAGRGGLYSGASLKALDDHRMNVASTDRDNQLNRLLGLTQIGQSSAAGANASGQNFSVGAGNALASGANAKAAGAIGVSNSLNAGIGNYLGYQMFDNLLAQ